MGRTPDGFHGTVPDPSTRPSTGTVPAAIGTAVQGRNTAMRSLRADVAAATPNMQAT